MFSHFVSRLPVRFLIVGSFVATLLVPVGAQAVNATGSGTSRDEVSLAGAPQTQVSNLRSSTSSAGVTPAAAIASLSRTYDSTGDAAQAQTERLSTIASQPTVTGPADCSNQYLDISGQTMKEVTSLSKPLSSCMTRYIFGSALQSGEEKNATISVEGYLPLVFVLRPDLSVCRPAALKNVPGLCPESAFASVLHIAATPSTQTSRLVSTGLKDRLFPEFNIFKGTFNYTLDASKAPHNRSAISNFYLLEYLITFSSGRQFLHGQFRRGFIIFATINGHPYFFFKLNPGENPRSLSFLMTRTVFAELPANANDKILDGTLGFHLYRGSPFFQYFRAIVSAYFLTRSISTAEGNAVFVGRLSLTSTFFMPVNTANPASGNNCDTSPNSRNPYCVHFKVYLANSTSFCVGSAVFVRGFLRIPFYASRDSLKVESCPTTVGPPDPPTHPF